MSKGYKIIWKDKELTKKAKGIAEEVAKKGAELVLKDAKRLVPKREGILESEIEIKKSIFEDGGYAIIAQGPGNYDKFYATFVELGTFKDSAQPYLRPALKRNKGRIHRMFQEAMK